MKKFFQKSASFAMAFLVLFSTMSFTVDKHFCGDYLVDLAIFSEAESCGMDHPSEGMMSADNGCSDQTISVEGQEELKISFDQLDLAQKMFVSAFTHAYFQVFEGVPQRVVPFSDYSPPIVVKDLQVLYDTFLI